MKAGGPGTITATFQPATLLLTGALILVGADAAVVVVAVSVLYAKGRFRSKDSKT